MDVDHFLKFFTEFVTVLLLFYVLAFLAMRHEDLRSLSRNQTIPPALEGEVLTTGPPGKSQHYHGGSNPHQAEIVFFPSTASLT